METFDTIFDLLADKYCTAYKLMERTRLNYRTVGMIINLLLNYGFATRAEGYALRIKLTPALQEFLRKIKWIEKTEH